MSGTCGHPGCTESAYSPHRAHMDTPELWHWQANQGPIEDYGRTRFKGRRSVHRLVDGEWVDVTDEYTGEGS